MTVVAGGDELGRAVRAAQPTEVVHLESVLDNPPTEEALEHNLTANFLSSVLLIQELIGGSVRRLIMMVSCEEYGRNPT